MSASASQRPLRLALLAVSLAAWWVGYRVVVPAVTRAVGFERITDRAVQNVVGHWLVWQLPGVLLCLAVWVLGQRLGLLPSLRRSLGLGRSGRRVLRSGLLATAVLLLISVVVGKAAGGTFGWHPYVPKMVGDLVSNLYEELVFRGLIFSAFYGVAAGATFALDGALDRRGVALGTVGSCVVFAAGHTQYPVSLRVVLGVIAVVFVWPWVRARSLWASWIPHTLGDVILDSVLKL